MNVTTSVHMWHSILLHITSLLRFLSLRNWQILESCIPDFHGALPILRASFLTGMWFWRPWRMGGSPTMLLLWPLARDELLGQNFCAIMFALQKSNIQVQFIPFGRSNDIDLLRRSLRVEQFGGIGWRKEISRLRLRLGYMITMLRIV